MTSDRIREVVRAEPFRPFRLHTGAGRSLDVLHPEFLALHPTGRIVVVFGPKDAMEIVDVLMIQSIEMLPMPSSGQKRRRAG